MLEGICKRQHGHSHGHHILALIGFQTNLSRHRNDEIGETATPGDLLAGIVDRVVVQQGTCESPFAVYRSCRDAQLLGDLRQR